MRAAAIAVPATVTFLLIIGPWARRVVRRDGDPEGNQLEQLNATRTTIVTAVGVVGLVVGGIGTVGTLVYTARTLRLGQDNLAVTRGGQITDRYAGAVDQLASTSVDVRMGGVYALQRVLRDSPDDDGPTVLQVLAAFVRGHATRPHPESPPPPDVDAAIRVLAARADKAFAVDVNDAHLEHVHLPGGDLTSADLSGTSLGGAEMPDARLARADLGSADLSGADLRRADLTGAVLNDGVNLQGADLARARLASADLHGPETEVAGANFAGADLNRTDLRGVDLRKARGLSSAQLARAVVDRQTRLPRGVARPKAHSR